MKYKILALATFVMCAIGGFQLNVMAFVLFLTSPFYAAWAWRAGIRPPKIGFDWLRLLKRKDWILAGAIFVLHLVAITLVGEAKNFPYILPITVPLHYALLGIMARWEQRRANKPYRPPIPWRSKILSFFGLEKSHRLERVPKKRLWKKLGL